MSLQEKPWDPCDTTALMVNCLSLLFGTPWRPRSFFFFLPTNKKQEHRGAFVPRNAPLGPGWFQYLLFFDTSQSWEQGQDKKRNKALDREVSHKPYMKLVLGKVCLQMNPRWNFYSYCYLVYVYPVLFFFFLPIFLYLGSLVLISEFKKWIAK